MAASQGAGDGSSNATAASEIELSTAHAMIVASFEDDDSQTSHQGDADQGPEAAPVVASEDVGKGSEGVAASIPPAGATAPAMPEDDDEALDKVINYAMGGDACGPFKWATAGHHLMPYHPSIYREDWKQLGRETLAGITVAFAQVSDSIAFAFIAGVGPLLGLHAAWIIGITMSAIGSRPGMINGATGVRAAVLAPYVAQLGVGYLFYIVIGISIFQFVASFFSLAKLVRLVTRPVMIGFVCGLAIIMAMGQIPAFYVPQTTTFNDGTTIGWQWFIIIVTLLGMVAWPYTPVVGSVLPPPLVGIFLAMALEFGVVRAIAGHKTPVVADLGKVSGGFPILFWLDDQYTDVLPPLTLEVVGQVLQPAFLAAAAGMVEAVMTMEVANDMTETDNPAPDQQLLALGIGNLLCGLLGTMGGGATIGPTVIACSNGANGRYRLSGIVAGIVLLLIILVASDVVAIIPTSALVAVMAVVCWATFEWSMPGMVLASMLPKQARSYIGLHRKVRRMDAIVMLVVTLVTIFVDLFTATMIGVGISAVSFSWNQAKEVTIVSKLSPLEEGDAEKILAHESSLEAEGDTPASRTQTVKEGPIKVASGPSDSTGDAKAVSLPLPAKMEAALSPEDGAGSAAADDGAIAGHHTESNAHLVETPTVSDAEEKPPGAEATDDVTEADDDVEDKDVDAESAAGKPQAKAAAAVAAGAGAAEASDLGEEPPQKRVYFISGCVFFASAMDFVQYFSPSIIKGDPTLVEFRFEDAAIGDYSGMHSLGVIAGKYARVGKKVVVKRLGQKSFKLVEKADHLIQHFEYELGRGAEDDDDEGSPEAQIRSRRSSLLPDGPVEAAAPMHIQATQAHLKA